MDFEAQPHNSIPYVHTGSVLHAYGSMKQVTFDPESFFHLRVRYQQKHNALVCRRKRLWNFVSHIMHENKDEGFRGQSAEQSIPI